MWKVQGLFRFIEYVGKVRANQTLDSVNIVPKPLRDKSACVFATRIEGHLLTNSQEHRAIYELKPLATMCCGKDRSNLYSMYFWIVCLHGNVVLSVFGQPNLLQPTASNSCSLEQRLSSFHTTSSIHNLTHFNDNTDDVHCLGLIEGQNTR